MISEECKNLEYLNVFLELDTGRKAPLASVPPEPDIVLETLSSFCDEENAMSEFTPAGIGKLVEGCPKLKTLVVNGVIERRLDIPKHITVLNEDKDWPVVP